jgi:hypothetical protein
MLQTAPKLASIGQENETRGKLKTNAPKSTPRLALREISQNINVQKNTTPLGKKSEEIKVCPLSILFNNHE